ncbi:MAG: 50S ribosomal protein L18 [Gammaproteobacteria bacterium]|nr:50S ribosomal protein L18 [Gammaproteobacteria bacterium]
MDKKQSRLRRARRTRAKIKSLGMHRLCIHRTSQHTYAQVFSPDGATVLASASTVETEIKSGLKHTANVEAAVKVGQAIAERAKASGVERVAFDRSGFKYHGRVKALADAARESGLQI